MRGEEKTGREQITKQKEVLMTEDLTLNMNAYLPLRDVVFNTLREAILKGELKPGERLMELQLAAKLGVSRTPIREAIRMLEQEGLAVTIPRKGGSCADDGKRHGGCLADPGCTRRTGGIDRLRTDFRGGAC